MRQAKGVLGEMLYGQTRKRSNYLVKVTRGMFGVRVSVIKHGGGIMLWGCSTLHKVNEIINITSNQQLDSFNLKTTGCSKTTNIKSDFETDKVTK